MTTKTLQLAVILLGLTLLACIIGVILLALTDHDAPDALQITAATCVGALGALLVPTPTDGAE